MSESTIRAAVVQLFTPPAISGIGIVYSGSIPRTQKPRDYLKPGQKSGAFAVAHIQHSFEHRTAFGQPGKKRVIYYCGLDIFARSSERDTQVAVAYWDQVTDDVKALLRTYSSDNSQPSGRTLNGVAFSAGEGAELGRPDIETAREEPKLNGQILEMWSVVWFYATEWINA